MQRFLPILFLLAASPIHGQSRELWFDSGISFLSNRQIGSPDPNGLSDDVTLGHGFRFGFRLGFDSSRRFGHEIQYGYSRTELTDRTGGILGFTGGAGMAIHQAGYNFLYYVATPREDAKVRPFFTAGVHFSDFALPSLAAVQGSSVKPGFNYGFGMKVRLSSLFAARFDIRGYDTGKPNWNGILFNRSGILQQTEATAGIGILF